LLVQSARAIRSLAAGRFDEAYVQLHRIFDPEDPNLGSHPLGRCWAVSYFADAALHSDNTDEARRLIAYTERQIEGLPSVEVHQQLRYARAVLADDDQAEALFRDALDPASAPNPFFRASLQLAYGAWLRRRRRVAESRVPLREARDTFDALGTTPWGDRARRELLAAGEESRRRSPQLREQLTPQELQIAQLAAEGRSNRDIGQLLFLSPRTVGAHLYRIFPKLGVTARGQLGRALAAPSVSVEDDVTDLR
jgi:DNA-binding CsgD family transcriptional regulator